MQICVKSRDYEHLSPDQGVQYHLIFQQDPEAFKDEIAEEMPCEIPAIPLFDL